MRLSTPEGPFSTFRLRVGARDSWWWLRTPSTVALANACLIGHSNRGVSIVGFHDHDWTGYLISDRDPGTIDHWWRPSRPHHPPVIQKAVNKKALRIISRIKSLTHSLTFVGDFILDRKTMPTLDGG